MVKTTKHKLHNNNAVFKPTTDIRLDRLAASREAIMQAKSATISLKDFIAENYHFEETVEVPTALKCTIRDIGLAPFELDIFDARIILVESTGKTRKDFDGNEVPERLYRGRFYSISAALGFIASIVSKRKIMGQESTILTLREYHNTYHNYYKYIAGIISKDYSKALDALQDKFPFTQISEGRDDEENWFKHK